MKDTMLIDGLTDAFNDYHMGITGKVSWINSMSSIAVILISTIIQHIPNYDQTIFLKLRMLQNNGKLRVNNKTSLLSVLRARQLKHRKKIFFKVK